MLKYDQFANLILSFESVSHKKLQKLCYYVYSWYLTVHQEEISNVNFEAWVHGPVSKEIYKEYRKYGWYTIPKYESYLNVPDDVIDFTSLVLNKYNKYSADELEEMSHKEIPWINARKGYNKYDSSSEIIDGNDITEYYKNHDFYKELVSTL